MSYFYENFGLEELYDEKDVMFNLECLALQNSKVIEGYYDTPYLYSNFGDMELVLYTERSEEGKLKIVHCDNHCRGNTIWEVVVSGLDANPKEFTHLKRHLMVKGAGGQQALLVINLMMPDVLPGFTENETVRMQVIGFPQHIKLYTDEDEYFEDQEVWKFNGEKLGLADGFIMPNGFLHNHDPERADEETDPEDDCLHLLRGIITGVYWGKLKFEGETLEHCFIRTYVNTRYGELQLVHSLDQIPKEQLDLLKPGNIISCLVYLSGDVAIDEYANGIVLDADHNYSLMAYTIEGGDPERLRKVLEDDCIYRAGTTGEEYHGADSIISQIKYVQANTSIEYRVLKAHILDEQNGVPDTESEGTRCLLLCDGDKTNIIAVCIVETNESGKIQRIETFPNLNYSFRTDPMPELHDPSDDLDDGERIDMSGMMVNSVRIENILPDNASSDHLHPESTQPSQD